jgi:hypothetical protein
VSDLILSKSKHKGTLSKCRVWRKTEQEVDEMRKYTLSLVGVVALFLAGVSAESAWGQTGKSETVFSSRLYAGERGSARLNRWEVDGSRKGVVLLVGGFTTSLNPDCGDASGSSENNFPTYYQYGEDKDDSMKAFWDQGFEINRINWCDAADYIQRNAFVLMDVLAAIRARRVAEEQLIVIGGSMGGLITRYALARMETEKNSHGVDVFISWDAPQEGAYIPLSIQYFSEFMTHTIDRGLDVPDFLLAMSPDILRTVYGADLPASRQMLVRHHSTPLALTPHADFVDFFTQLRNQYGNYPKTAGLRMVAIANGSGLGYNTRPAVGYHPNPRLPIISNWKFGIDLRPVGIQFQANLSLDLTATLGMTMAPLTASGEHRVFSMNGGLTWKLNGLAFSPNDVEASVTFIKYTVLGIQRNSALDLAADPVVRITLNAILKVVESASAQRVNFGYNAYGEWPYLYEAAGGGVGEHYQYLKDIFEGDKPNDTTIYNTFVPTTSALGLAIPPNTAITEAIKKSSPFQEVVIHHTDTAHGGYTFETHRQFIRELNRAVGTPCVTMIDPALKTAGRAGFPMRVFGFNFKTTTRVAFKGVAKSTTFRSNSELEVTISAADIASPGNFEVTVTDPAQGKPFACTATLTVLPNPLSMQPATPTTKDVITTKFSDDSRNTCIPRDPVVTVSGNRINVTATNIATICGFAITPYVIEVAFGPLAVGNYDLVVGSRESASFVRELGRRNFTVSHAAPVLTRVTPNSVAADGNGFTITVDGDNFVSGVSKVLWNGSERPTRFLSSTTLEADIARTDIALQREAQISVQNGEGILSAGMPFEITQAVPAIVSLAPPAVLAGSSDISMIIEGRNFTGNSAAFWTGVEGVPEQRATRFLDSTRLAITVPARDLRAAGAFAVTILETNNLTSDPHRFTVEATADDSASMATLALSQIADGAGWRTSIILMNTASEETTFTLRFFDPLGGPLTLPVQEKGTISEFAGTIAPGGSQIIETEGTSPQLLDGWAEISSTRTLRGRAIFRQLRGDGVESEAAVPLGTATSQTLLLAFDDRAGFRTAAALLNMHPSATASVSLKFRDENGNLVSTESLVLPPRNRQTFYLADRFPALSGGAGVAEIFAEQGELQVMGLRFNPRGAFTSFEAIGPQPDTPGTQHSRIAQVADGAGWKTAIVLMNTGTAAAPFTVDFHKPDGSPLPVWIQGIGLVSQISQTIPIRGLRIFETTGDSPTLSEGWAKVVSTGSIGGTAIFRQRRDGLDSEAVVAVTSSVGAALVLPFDNSGGFSTAVAALNPTTIPMTVGITFRDENGVLISEETLILEPANRTAVFLPARYPSVINRRGSAEFHGADVAIIGLRFNSGLSFTSMAPVRK